MSGTNARNRIRTPGTPTKVRTRREELSSFDEIPTKDLTRSKSVGGTPKTRYLISSSAVRRSCPEFSVAIQNGKHFRRHSESRGYVNRSNHTENQQGSRSQSCIVGPNITNNSAFSSDLSVASTTNKTNTLSKNIYKLWKNGQLCDVVINAGGSRFYVHRLVMAASCEHFARHADTMKQAICEYDVPNVSAKVMDEVLDFFYTTRLKITHENVQELLEASQNLGIKKLLDMCIAFLRKVSLNNAVRNRVIAQRYGLNGVVSSIDQYIHEHFSTLVTTSTFLHSDFCYIYDIISSGILTTPNELQIFHACAKWIDFERGDRIKFAVALMSLIRFVLIPASNIVAEVEPVTFIFDIPECKDMLYNAFRHHALFAENKDSNRGGVASRSVPHNVENIERNGKAHVGHISETDKSELEEQSSEITETSDTMTSMEYDLQSAEMIHGKGSVVKDDSRDKDINKSDESPMRQTHVRPKSAAEVTSGSSHLVSNSGSNSEAGFQAKTVRSAGNTESTGNVRSAGNVQSATKVDFCYAKTRRASYSSDFLASVDKQKGKERDRFISVLEKRLSNASVNPKKTSSKELARMVDFRDPDRKASRGSVCKSATESHCAMNSGKFINSELSSSTKAVNSKVKSLGEMFELRPDTQKTRSAEKEILKNTDEATSGRHISPAILQRSNRGAEAIPSQPRSYRAAGNCIELSPIKSEPSLSDLPPPPQPRVIMVIGGAGAYTDDNGHINNSLQQFDPELNTWRLRSQLPVPVHYSDVAVLNGCIYVIGGRLSNTHDVVPIKDVYRYDITSDRWDKVASLNTMRSRHVAVMLNGAIYAIGGEDCIGMSLKTAEVYRSADNSWSFIAPMNEARVDPAVAAHRGRVYVAGGIMDMDQKLLLNTMEVYDPRTREWTFRYPLPVAVCGSSLVESAGVLYLVGGFVMRDGEPLSLDSIFQYTDETDSWEGFKTLHVPRHNAVVISMDSRLYIIGGESSAAMGHALSNVECIDIEADEHVPCIAPLLTPTYGISGCAFVSDGN